MPPVLRSNPLYTEEEEQEVVIIVDSLEDSPEVEAPEAPRVPRRAPSTSSGYGSGGGSHGRVSPSLPKIETYEPQLPRRLSDCEKNEGSQSTSDSDGSPICTLSRSLKDDIRACLGGCRWEKDVGELVEAAVRGAGGVSAARARLHAALRALHDPPPNRGPSLPYCGPGVRPGDVTMMPKNEMSLLSRRPMYLEISQLRGRYYSAQVYATDIRHDQREIRLSTDFLQAASALFTLDGARGEALARRLARGEKRRRRCRVALAVIAILLLLAAVCAVELFMSRGQRVFGAVLR